MMFMKSLEIDVVSDSTTPYHDMVLLYRGSEHLTKKISGHQSIQHFASTMAEPSEAWNGITGLSGILRLEHAA